MTMSVHEAGFAFVDPSAYADEPRFEAATALLREHDPVHWVEGPGFNPFWAITKHADIFDIEAKHQIFLNEPRPILGSALDDARRAEHGDLLRTLIHVDDPEHRQLRGVTSDWFLPKSLTKLEGQLAGLAKATVDKMASLDGQCDFPRMLTLTQERFGAADEDLQRGSSPEDVAAVVGDFIAYFAALTEQRRAQPTGDLASVVANATIEGEPLTLMQTISYYVIAATAGHDTTASAMAGGMLALIEHPEQLERLRHDPSLMNTAVDEMIRWVTPVKHFMRTATTDFALRDKTIAAGQSVLLSYPSGNRDSDAFVDPFTFDVGRSPNKHLSLARMELKALFTELLPRLDTIELAGEPALMKTIFVGGLKRLPVQYRMR